MHLLAVLILLPALQETPEAELNRLETEYAKQRDAFFAAYYASTDPNERRRVSETSELRRTALPKFRDVARRAAGTDTGAMAHFAALNVGWDLNDERIVRESVDALAAGYLGSPKLEDMAHYLQGGNVRGWSWCRPMLRLLSEKAGDPKAKKAFRFRMACTLIRDPKSTPEEQAEARRILGEVIAADSNPEVVGQAQAEIFEFDHLRVGGRPPDFDATDQDGKPFKLSDYRGKVVVLDFWGFW